MHVLYDSHLLVTILSCILHSSFRRMKFDATVQMEFHVTTTSSQEAYIMNSEGIMFKKILRATLIVAVVVGASFFMQTNAVAFQVHWIDNVWLASSHLVGTASHSVQCRARANSNIVADSLSISFKCGITGDMKQASRTASNVTSVTHSTSNSVIVSVGTCTLAKIEWIASTRIVGPLIGSASHFPLSHQICS